MASETSADGSRCAGGAQRHALWTLLQCWGRACAAGLPQAQANWSSLAPATRSMRDCSSRTLAQAGGWLTSHKPRACVALT